MRFGGIVAPNGGCLSLTLGLCSSFRFGVVSVLLSRFDTPLKCTVNTIEQRHEGTFCAIVFTVPFPLRFRSVSVQ